MWCSRLLLTGFISVFSVSTHAAQCTVVWVNGDPVTRHEVTQRQRYLALTAGMREKMQTRLKSPATREQFKTYIRKERPASPEEEKALQKKFVTTIMKQVVSSAARERRKEAIGQLIDEKLMTQAAKAQNIIVTDDEVNDALTRGVENREPKGSLGAFLSLFTEYGVDPDTFREQIRARTEWRRMVQRLYGSRLLLVPPYRNDADALLLDVRVVRLGLPAKANQQIAATRLIEAEQLRQRFTSCETLGDLMKSVKDVTVRRMTSARIFDFRHKFKQALLMASPRRMTPPVIAGGAIEMHALCSAKESVTSDQSTETKLYAGVDDYIQESYRFHAYRHLRYLKDRARIKYPKRSC